jgi:2,3-bisphosphoglycerate-dependent phosphoglycerate mutase
MGTLVIVRHGESIYNADSRWTGRTDVDLTPRGEEEAKKAGEIIKAIKFSSCFCSMLKRSKHTLQIILDTIGQTSIPTFESKDLNERDYGDYTGLNKWEVRKMLGEQVFIDLWRSWEGTVPHGESLKDVYNRVKPYYEKEILPRLTKGENVLVVIHGNSMRALIKHIEQVPDRDVAKILTNTGDIYKYVVGNDGLMMDRSVLHVRTDFIPAPPTDHIV